MGKFANWLALNEDAGTFAMGGTDPVDNGLARPQQYTPTDKVSVFANKLFGVNSTKPRVSQIRKDNYVKKRSHNAREN